MMWCFPPFSVLLNGGEHDRGTKGHPVRLKIIIHEYRDYPRVVVVVPVPVRKH
jgi:hypothetical protein